MLQRFTGSLLLSLILCAWPKSLNANPADENRTYIRINATAGVMFDEPALFLTGEIGSMRSRGFSAGLMTGALAYSEPFVSPSKTEDFDFMLKLGPVLRAELLPRSSISPFAAIAGGASFHRYNWSEPGQSTTSATSLFVKPEIGIRAGRAESFNVGA